MFRRISTKLVLAVLAAVVLPFAAFAFFVDTQMAERLSREVVLYSLKALAADLSQRVDRRALDCALDVELWRRSPLNAWAIDEGQGSILPVLGRSPRELQASNFDAAVETKQVYDLLLLVDAEGRLVVSNRRDARGRPLAPGALAALAARDFSLLPWFQAALQGETPRLDPHISELIPPQNPGPGPHPENLHLGFAAPVRRGIGADAITGAIFALVNWKHFQAEVGEPVLKEYFRGLVGPQEYPSAYGWIWGSDADTILAHPRFELFGKRVSGPDVGLPQMVEAARQSDWGLFEEYTFRGKRKNAAFKRCAGPEQGGFGWVVGVGIDNDDIYATVHELRELLYKGTLLVVLVVVLWTMVIARRTTSPILALKSHTERVASGDLEARIRVGSDDELGELARAFNQMTAELAENRAQLVRAEKDAAWREMARQVAHDIKNPLTPIKLSADLLRRAKEERSPQFDAIFDRTLDTISRQVENLRAIASDFHALTGAPRHHPKLFDLAPLLRDVLELNAAWAQELGVAVTLPEGSALVFADPDQLRRVLVNLVTNALEAMPEGGELRTSVGRETSSGGEMAVVEIRDTGPGISKEVQAHLFEPYFTTRSTGTGLGLAIAKRVVSEMGGVISLEPVAAERGGGTLARIRLPSKATLTESSRVGDGSPP